MGVNHRYTALFLITAFLAVATVAIATDVSAENEDGNVYAKETGQSYDTLAEAFADAYGDGYRNIHLTLLNEGEYELGFAFSWCDLTITG